MLLDFYATITALPSYTVTPAKAIYKRLNAKSGSVVNVHISIRNIPVVKQRLLLQKMFTRLYLATRTPLSTVLPVRIHTAQDQIAPVVYWPEPCKHISQRCGIQVIMWDRPTETYHCVCIWFLGNQSRKRLHTMSSTTEWQRSWWLKWRADSFNELPWH